MTIITIEVHAGTDCFTYSEPVPHSLEFDERMARLVAQGILYENGWCLDKRLEYEFSVGPDGDSARKEG